MNFFIQNNKTLNFTVKNTVTHETDICIHYVLKFIPNLRFISTQNLNAWKQMTATAEGPVTVLVIVIATPDGLGTQIVPTVS